jgi:plastocyanin
MKSKSTLLAAALSLAPVCAWAAPHTVQVGGSAGQLVFTPANTDVLVGDTVTFTNIGGFHNVASDAGAPFAFRCSVDCGANGGGDGSAWSSTITIPPEAAHQTVGFHCEVHGAIMSGTLSVTNPVDLQSFEID